MREYPCLVDVGNSESHRQVATNLSRSGKASGIDYWRNITLDNELGSRPSHGQTLRMRLSSLRFVRNIAVFGTPTYFWAPFKQVSPYSYRAEGNPGLGLTGSPLGTPSPATLVCVVGISPLPI